MTRRTLPALAYDALTLEGSLFNAEWLAKVAHLEAPRQQPDDYAIPAGLNLRDEIARAWRMAQAQWLKFQPTLATPTPTPTPVTAERFVTALLETVGFDALAKRAEPIVLGERSFPISHTQGHVPVLIAAPSEGLDDGHARFGEAGRRRSPFGLLQEYLNAADAALWGLVSNGLKLRLVRDNLSLTRPAWLEADLERIFTEERFADFSALWLTLHASRFGRPDGDPADCALEVWRQVGQQTGIRARDELRRGVERAILELGQGFLAEPANTELRAALITGQLTPAGYFQQLLRLVYRLIFLLTVEERGLLHPPASDPAAQRLYERGYGLRRLRERAVRHSAHDAHTDLHAALKITFRGLASGEPRLALPALGGLFGTEQTPWLDAAALQNRHLLGALWALAWIARDGATERVNWHDMGPEELGSVYESLLELVPVVDEGATRFSFAGGDETRGNARKLSGSYYTPDSLVQALLDSALEPVIAQKKAERPDDEAAAILSVTVIDPAVGSGHFLLAAARRLAAHLARARAQGQPGAAEHRRALREVVSHCLFGVDRNPMALELARIALWLEAMTPEAPLSFLDTHLVLGDALLGVLDPACLTQGIADDAFKPLTGDDKATCERLKKRNREARKALARLTEQGPQPLLDFARDTVAAELAALDDLPDDTLEQIAAKRAAYEAVRAQQERAGLAEDLLLAAYLTPKRPDTEARIPTGEHLLRALTGQPVDEAVIETARQTARAHQVLHWREAFAQVFARGGFDCVLGNPPWERIKLQEQEFFASRAPDVANARNKAERARAIAALERAPADSPERRLFEAFETAKRAAEAASAFAHDGLRYPLTGVGDVNTYALFAETALALRAAQGRAGIIVPSGVATDDSTKAFFSHIADGRLVSLFDFENRDALFPGVHRSYKFSLLTLGQAERAELAFFLTAPEQLKDARRRFALTPAEFALLNPNTRTCPVFRSQADAELTKKIYRRVPVLWDERRPDGNPWGLTFATLFHMSNDSGLFRTAARRGELADPLPLYEAKMIHQFDHRWATYAGAQATLADDDAADGARDSTPDEKARPDYAATPRYWVERAEVEARLRDKQWPRGWLMGWRDITNATNERTVIAAVVPRVAVGHKMPLFLSAQSPAVLCGLLGNLNALCLDFVARQKVGGTSLTYFYLKQFTVLPPTAYTPEALAFIVPRVLELTYTADDLAPFYDDLVAENPAFDPRPPSERGQPFPWNPERRAKLRAELDACYARLYGLTRDELRYLLDPAGVMGADYPSETFRVLKDKETRQHGEYRTQRLVLEAWDRLNDDQ
ncbi:MAG: N-6 DNA methylase [Pseudomonadales bacterium]|nr:N-6 DNA methylase [Pseudomonadales bacterium]